MDWIPDFLSFNTMPEYKKQHYLPVSYLGHFGFPFERKLRKRYVWRVSATDHQLVHVESQCHGKWFYSKEHAEDAEKYFSKGENLYSQIMAKLINGEDLSHEILFLVFLMAVDFYARGYRFQADESSDNFKNYRKRSQIFKNHLIFPKLCEHDDETKMHFILRRWEFRVVKFSQSDALLTSDFPSLVFGHSHDPKLLKGIILPISPLHCFVGVSNDKYRITDTDPGAMDSSILNVNQIENCFKNVYFPGDLTEYQLDTIRNKMGTDKHKRISKIDYGWEIEFIDYDKNPNLSFIKSIYS